MDVHMCTSSRILEPHLVHFTLHILHAVAQRCEKKILGAIRKHLSNSWTFGGKAHTPHVYAHYTHTCMDARTQMHTCTHT